MAIKIVAEYANSYGGCLTIELSEEVEQDNETENGALRRRVHIHHHLRSPRYNDRPHTSLSWSTVGARDVQDAAAFASLLSHALVYATDLASGRLEVKKVLATFPRHEARKQTEETDAENPNGEVDHAV